MRADAASGRISALVTSDVPLVTGFRVVSGNPWFPKWAGRLRQGVRVYSHCPRSHAWDGVTVDYVPMVFYPFGKLDALFNRVGEPLLALGWLSLKKPLMKIVREFRPDVVYAHHTVPNGYFAMRLQEQTGMPFVVTDHEMGEITACKEFPARKAVYDKVTRAAFRMVSVAGVMQRDMERVFPQARCETIHNGIGERGAEVSGQRSEVRGRRSAGGPVLQCFGESVFRRSEDGAAESRGGSVAQSAGVSGKGKESGVKSGESGVASGGSEHSGGVVVFSCGMFYGRKNFPGLIQAFNLVAEKYPDVVLKIAGDGPDRPEVAAERGRSPFKERIELLGKVSHNEVLQQMREADIFALIGWREPFATVFLEAMAVGLPVIACDDGGIAEVIHAAVIPEAAAQKVEWSEGDCNGVLVPPKDIPAAARALEFLLLHPEARRAIGGAAKRKIEAELTWDAVVGKYVRLFGEAVGSGEAA